jgi:hypothetical protein
LLRVTFSPQQSRAIVEVDSMNALDGVQWRGSFELDPLEQREIDGLVGQVPPSLIALVKGSLMAISQDLHWFVRRSGTGRP